MDYKLNKIMLENDKNNISDYLDYEIRSSWWACWIGWDWGQAIAGKYFAWKTKRKYARYKYSKRLEKLIKDDVINVNNLL